MPKPSFYIINSITIYRALATILLLYFIYAGEIELFRWFLAFSFFTDLLDGMLARRYNVSSIMGSRLDSVADDLTVLAGIVGTVVLKYEFVHAHLVIINILIGLYVLQLVMSLIRYGKLSSFHTITAKAAALSQGGFLILLFFLPQPPFCIFYIAATVTIIDLVEEIILVIILSKWAVDVKGLYWVLRKKRQVN